MLLLTHISELVTMRGGEGPRRGGELGDAGMIRDAAVLMVGGKIVAADTQAKVLRHAWVRKNARKLVEIDCRGKTVLPGFVDSHTHPVFAEPRLVDFEKRIAGASYEEIAAAGGGIRSSVAGVRAAQKAKLAKRTLAALEQMLEHGTTTAEAKSGYGLSLESEMKSLEAVRAAARLWPGTVVPTLLGAHVVPTEYAKKPEKYVELVCRKMIPVAAQRKLAKFVDVFCERGAFSLEDAEMIFAAAREHGMGARAHVGQFSACGLKPLLQEGTASLDHMDHVHDDDLRLLSKSGTVATLVPASNHFLGHGRYPDARKMIAAGVAVALATDYNPGTAPTASIPFVLSLACTQMKMTPGEAIAAATINGAHALGLGGSKGSIEPGKDADVVIFDCRDHREICYWMGTNLVERVMVNGEMVAERA